MKIPNTLLAAMAALAIGLLSGCSTTTPIKTTLDLQSTEAGLPVLNYSSEKDVLYKRTSTSPETGIVEQVEFRAEASPQARIQAEAAKAQAEALNAAVSALSANAASALGAQPVD